MSISHAKRHNMGSGTDHKGDIFDALTNPPNPLTLTNYVVDKQTLFSEIQKALVGLSWQEMVLDFIDFTTSEPGTPSVGHRYINTATGISSVTSQSVTAEDIYEWNGSDWTEAAPSEGWCLTVDDEDTTYYYSDALDWVKFGTVIDHANLQNLGWSVSGHVMNAPLDMNGQQINELAEPSIAQDAATKSYVDNKAHEGTTILSTGQTSDKYLRANGSGGASWQSLGLGLDVCSQRTPSAQTPLPTTGYLTIDWSGMLYETHTFFNPTYPTRITIPTGQGGRYRITCITNVWGNVGTAYTGHWMHLCKNGDHNYGIAYSSHRCGNSPFTTTETPTLLLDTEEALNAGDWIEVDVQCHTLQANQWLNRGTSYVKLTVRRVA